MPFPAHSRRLTRALAVALTAGAVAAPAAFAGPAIGPDGGDGPPVEPAPVIVRSVDQGFDVGSAAIGAGGAGALLVLISLGGFAWVARHPRSSVAG